MADETGDTDRNTPSPEPTTPDENLLDNSNPSSTDSDPVPNESNGNTQSQWTITFGIWGTIMQWLGFSDSSDDDTPQDNYGNTENNRLFRVINTEYPNAEVSENDSKFISNIVATTKYTLLTFFPRSLFEQFRRLANVYFLVICILMILGTYTSLFDSPITPWTTLFPLLVVLAVTMGKEGFEDGKRRNADRETNNRKTHELSLNPDSTSNENDLFEEIEWKNVKVGRIIKIQDREEIPADLLLLTSSEAGGICYIETANIDGETNLKIKQSARTNDEGTGPRWENPNELLNWTAVFECEAPNSRIHTFNGVIHWETGEDDDENAPSSQTPVDQSTLLLRGSVLRNTKWILGLVVYTGYDTKIVRNSRAAPSKLSTIERTTNRLLYLILATQVLLVTVTLICYEVWQNNNEEYLYYLCYDFSDCDVSFYENNCEDTDNYTWFGMWLTFLILFNNFVPISLYVTIEMVNYSQAYFMDQDREMYDPISDTPFLARTSNMNGDLAAIQYVFSDKTGTLTQNVMRFKRCSVGGTVYGLGADEELELERQSKATEEDENGEENETTPEVAPGHRTIKGESLITLTSKALEQGGGLASNDNPAFQFLQILSVCHTVLVEEEKESTSSSSTDSNSNNASKKIYVAESPDEEALVSAASDLAFTCSSRSNTTMSIEIGKGYGNYIGNVNYKILALIPFTSARKRMSVIVERESDSQIIVLAKGADNVMFRRANAYMGTTRDELDDHLSVFAADGLRTLVLGVKFVTRQEFNIWFEKYTEATTRVEGRVEAIEKAAEEIEIDFSIVGVTAIEDKLQDGVPDTIKNLKDMGIKVWVATGDKMETAINIGYSCKLLNSQMVLMKITDKGDTEEATEQLRDQMRRLIRHFERLIEDDEMFGNWWQLGKIVGNIGQAFQNLRKSKASQDKDSGTASVIPPTPPRVETDALSDPSTLPAPLLDVQPNAPTWEQLGSDHLALIVDGPALSHIFGDGEMERMLLKLATLCSAVIACRASPAQKRMLVRLVKRGVKSNPLTLSIGDGANDVAMIQEAQIGVGISGREGRQAVNASDFAIAQFRFLERLLILHGRWNYRRISKTIVYSFYKNVVLTFILFYYCIYCGWSGQSLYEDYVYGGYNFFLAMPIICVGMFDRDMEPKTLEKFKWTYMSGRLNLDLSVKLMAEGLVQAIVDSLVLYFICYGVFNTAYGDWAERGYSDDLYIFGLTVYSAMLAAMFIKNATLTYTWTWVNWFFFLGSIALYFIFLFAYGCVAGLVEYSGSFFWVPIEMFSRPIFWLLMLLVPLMCMIVDQFLIYTKLAFYPSPVDIAIEYDRGYRGDDTAEGAVIPPTLKFLDNVNNRIMNVGKDVLERLNASTSEVDKNQMGLRDGSVYESSYDFSGAATDYGPGAGGGHIRQPSETDQSPKGTLKHNPPDIGF